MIGPSLLLAASVLAVEPLTPPAPEFPPQAVWLNSKPLTLRSLHDKKVALLFFFNTANVNSLRALGAVKALESRYSPGLVLVGVDTPDYDFQKDPREAAAAVLRLGIGFPVIVDGERAMWNAYATEGWPSFVLIDRKGLIKADTLGERGYAELEEALRAALDKLPRYEVPAVAAPVAEPETRDCGVMTPEVALGTRGPASPLKLTQEANRLFYRDGAAEGSWGIAGAWTREKDLVRLPANNRTRQAFLSVLYRGVRAYALMSAPKKPARVLVRQDDEWLRREGAGADVRFDEELKSYVDVKETRPYRLTKNPDDSQRELTLLPLEAGTAVYAFSFSDRCLAPFLP